jgi:N-acetylmuramoyl-L-alanine amidase
MQLTSIGIKHWADDYFKAGLHDEYTSGRWHPEHNIRAAARYFADRLKATGISPTDANVTQQEAMWQAGSMYMTGSDKFSARHDQLRKAVLNSPGFMKQVTEIKQALTQNSIDSGDFNTDGTVAGKLLPDGWPTEAQALAAFQHGLWLGPPTTNPDPNPPPPPQIGLPPIKWLAAGSSFYAQGRGAGLPTIMWIVIHTMEVPEEDGMAASVASAFASEKGLVRSAHYNIDHKEIYQSVRDEDTAYGVIGTATIGSDVKSINQWSLHFEHAGRASQDVTQWNDKYSQDMLRISAQLTAQKAKKFNIPVIFRDVDGLQNGMKGFTGHSYLSQAFAPAYAHGDPGAGFPWVNYLALVDSYM